MRFRFVTLVALAMCSLAASMTMPATEAAGPHGTCRMVGGHIDASLTGIPDPTVSGTVTGGLAGTVNATVHGQQESGYQTILDLTHEFTTGEGAVATGTLNTLDTGTWTPIPGQDNVVRMFTKYVIVGGEGGFAGAGGLLINHGTVNLDTGVFDLSYGGVVCY